MFARKRKRVPKQSEDADEGDDLVELVRVGAVEAQLVAGRLRESGIDAAVFGTGENEGLIFTEGARVMVRRRDAEAAASLLHD
jgi:hypothetical protein